jgi:1-deoxy-D-xylulose-5-phosphate synthase
MRFVKPLDVDLVLALAAKHKLLVTVEENAVQGGAGSAVVETLQKNASLTSCVILGLPDSFIEHGNAEAMLAACGLDATGIMASVNQALGISSERLKK